MARSRKLGRPDQNYVAPPGKLHSLWGAVLGGLATPALAPATSAAVGAAEASAMPSISPEMVAMDTGLDPDAMGVVNTQAAALNPPAISTIQAPQFKKPGIVANILTKGEAGTNYKRLQGNLAATGYEAQLKEALNQQTRAAMLQQEQAHHLNALTQEQTKVDLETAAKQKLAEDEFRRLPEVQKIMAAYKNNVNPENFSAVEQTALAKMLGERAQLGAVEPLYGSPGYVKSFQDKLFAENEAPGVKNLLDRSSALRNSYFNLDKGALINLQNPSTGSFVSLPGEEGAETREARANSVNAFNPNDGTILKAVPKKQTPPGDKVSDVVNAAPPNPIQPRVTVPTSPNDLFQPLPLQEGATAPSVLDEVMNFLRRQAKSLPPGF